MKVGWGRGFQARARRFVVALAWLTGLLVAGPAWASGSVQVLEEACFSLLESDVPPGPDVPCEPVTLPDRWSERRPQAHGSGWYRFKLPPVKTSGGHERWAVLLPKVNMNAEVFVTGRWVGSGGSFALPVAQNWNNPLLFSFSRDAIEEGGRLDVRVHAYRGDWGGLGPVLVGPHAELAERYERQVLWQVLPWKVASVVALTLIPLFLVLWLGFDRNPMYGYFLLASTCYFIHSLSACVRDIVVPYPLGRWLVHAAIDWFAAWMVMSGHRRFGLRRPRFERAMLAITALGSAAMALAGADAFNRVMSVAHLFALAVAIHCMATLSRRLGQLPRYEAGILLGGWGVSLVLCTHVVLIRFGVLPQDTPRLLHLLAPMLLLGMGGVLMGELIRTFRAHKALNAELDQRVRDKQAELEKNFARLRRLESERLVVDERERIMREMHDGMGSSLVSTLAMVEGGDAPGPQIAEALRVALLDMRVVMDSLDSSAADLASTLGALRSRLEPRLRRNGLRVVWAVTDTPPIPHFGPESALHVMRIVQEAVTNALVHGGASELRFRTGTREGPGGEEGIFVEVADDGRGFAEAAPRGRGLRNMQYRAARIGGRVTVDGSAGTTVTLWIRRLQPSSERTPRLTAS